MKKIFLKIGCILMVAPLTLLTLCMLVIVMSIPISILDEMFYPGLSKQLPTTIGWYILWGVSIIIGCINAYGLYGIESDIMGRKEVPDAS